MSSTEHILSMVISLGVLLLIGILLLFSSTDHTVSMYELKQQEFLHDQQATHFNTFLQLTENTSQRTFSDLLSDSLTYQKEVLNYSDVTVNVTEEVSIVLDEMYGEGRYYLEIKPRIIDVSLNFIIDGSDSLQAEREKLAQDLPDIMDRVKEQINETGDEIVFSKIYILGEDTDENDNCALYEAGRKDINCEILGFSELYHNPSASQGGNEGKRALEYLFTFDVTPPFSNLRFIENNRKGGKTDFYEADWASGSAYASAAIVGKARLVLLFPMGDELSTSSINSQCFAMESGMQQTLCDLCEPSCTDPETVNRSKKQIDKALEVITAHKHVVNPIFAYTCDYDYKEIFNTYYEIEYNEQTTNMCGEAQCGGCSVESEGVCFHPECKDTILDQMEHMASETGGRVIDLKEIETLDYDITTVIEQNINEYRISIGTQRNATTQLVYTRRVPLSNKLVTDVSLYLYHEDQ